MKPSADIAARIDEAGRALAQALGARVACIALYGSAAGEEFSPEHSDVNLLVVLREVELADLRLVGDVLEREAKRQRLRFATPLVVRTEFLTGALDSFPIEIEDIRRRHRVLAGEDLVASLRVSQAAIRVAAEREARALLLRLHALIVHRPPDAPAHEALAHLGAAFRVVVRALLGLGAADAPAADPIGALAQRLRIEIRGFAQLLEMRAGTRPWPAEAEIDELCGRLRRELEAVVQAIDAQRV